MYLHTRCVGMMVGMELCAPNVETCEDSYPLLRFTTQAGSTTGK